MPCVSALHELKLNDLRHSRGFTPLNYSSPSLFFYHARHTLLPVLVSKANFFDAAKHIELKKI